MTSIYVGHLLMKSWPASLVYHEISNILTFLSSVDISFIIRSPWKKKKKTRCCKLRIYTWLCMVVNGNQPWFQAHKKVLLQALFPIAAIPLYLVLEALLLSFACHALKEYIPLELNSNRSVTTLWSSLLNVTLVDGSFQKPPFSIAYDCCFLAINKIKNEIAG